MVEYRSTGRGYPFDTATSSFGHIIGHHYLIISFASSCLHFLQYELYQTVGIMICILITQGGCGARGHGLPQVGEVESAPEHDASEGVGAG